MIYCNIPTPPGHPREWPCRAGDLDETRFEHWTGEHYRVSRPQDEDFSGFHPVDWEPWQRWFFRQLYQRREQGGLRFKEAVFSVPAKHGKSELGAACGLHGVLFMGEPEPITLYLANSIDQAAIMWRNIVRVIEMDPLLSRNIKVYRSPRHLEIVSKKWGTGYLFVLPKEGVTAHGIKWTTLIIDEGWAYGPEDYELLEALKFNPAARYPLRLWVTYKGRVREKGIPLWDLEERAHRGEDPRLLWFESSGPEEMSPLEAAMDARLAPWITEEYLEEEFRSLPRNMFRRLHANQWAVAEEGLVSEEEWDACIDSDYHPGPSDGFVIWGLDLGLKHDPSALVGVRYEPLLRRVGVVEAMRWVPKPDSPVILSVVEQTIRNMLQHYPDSIIYGDPHQLASMRERLKGEGIPVVELPQHTGNLATMCSTLYDMILRRRLIVPRGMDDLRQNVLNAVAVETERGLKLSKSRSSRKIDMAVALAMALTKVRVPPEEAPDEIVVI